MIGLESYLVLSGLLFTIGALGVLTKRNPIVIFMCIELMLNSVNLSLAAFSRHLAHPGGQLFVLFVMGLAAAEVAIGLGIIVAIFRTKDTINIDEINLLKG